MPMAKGKDGKPYVFVKLTDNLQQQMDDWKEASGSGYSDTIRSALLEYLKPRLKELPPRKKEVLFPFQIVTVDKGNQAEKSAQARDAIKTYFKELLGQLKTRHGGDYAQVRADLDKEISTKVTEFEFAGYAPSIDSVCELIVMDPDTADSMKDYARTVQSPPTRRRGKGKA